MTGGDDFDNVIVEWLMKEHLQKASDLRSPATVARLKALAEAAKVCAEPAVMWYPEHSDAA